MATLLSIRDDGDPLPAAGVCISPWVDMEGTGDSMKSKAGVDPMVSKEGLIDMAQSSWVMATGATRLQPRFTLTSPDCRRY